MTINVDNMGLSSFKNRGVKTEEAVLIAWASNEVWFPRYPDEPTFVQGREKVLKFSKMLIQKAREARLNFMKSKPIAYRGNSYQDFMQCCVRCVRQLSAARLKGYKGEIDDFFLKYLDIPNMIYYYSLGELMEFMEAESWEILAEHCGYDKSFGHTAPSTE